MRAWTRTVPLAALLAAACASTSSRSVEAPPPTFTRGWSAYSPEELNRDVVQCAETARAALEQGGAGRSRAELRAKLRKRTTRCMEERGWKLATPGGS